MPNKQKSKTVELYKITGATGKHRFYESTAAFEKGWKTHAGHSFRWTDVVAYRLIKMVWVEFRRQPPNRVSVKRPPQAYDENGLPVTFIGRLENIETLDAVLSGALNSHKVRKNRKR